MSDAALRAIRQLRPNVSFQIGDPNDPATLVWTDPDTTPPTLDEINAAIAALPPLPVYVPTFTLLGRLTAAEYLGIRQAAAAQLAAGNAQLEQWLDMARTAPNGINLVDPTTASAKAALVAAGLLAQVRADAIFKGL
jgi:hypothetical protein